MDNRENKVDPDTVLNAYIRGKNAITGWYDLGYFLM